MEELESKLGALLSSPGTMEKIMQLARSFSGETEAPCAPAAPAPEPEGAFDPRMMQLVASAMRAYSAPSETETLLGAIRSCLDPVRAGRLERAMGIAKLTRVVRRLLPELGGGHV